MELTLVYSDGKSVDQKYFKKQKEKTKQTHERPTVKWDDIDEPLLDATKFLKRRVEAQRNIAKWDCLKIKEKLPLLNSAEDNLRRRFYEHVLESFELFITCQDKYLEMKKVLNNACISYTDDNIFEVYGKYIQE